MARYACHAPAYPRYWVCTHDARLCSYPGCMGRAFACCFDGYGHARACHIVTEPGRLLCIKSLGSTGHARTKRLNAYPRKKSNDGDLEGHVTVQPCYLCKQTGHTTMTCPYRIAPEHGCVQATNASSNSLLATVLQRESNGRYAAVRRDPFGPIQIRIDPC